MQENLLSESCSPTWPTSAIGGRTTASELPTWARLTDDSAGSASRPSHLLPTPSAQESTPTDEFVEELREHLDAADPHHRLWLPGRKWMAQRTLSRTIPALLPPPTEEADSEPPLLPTPGAWLGRRPENSMADPERARSREHEGKRGKRSFELPDAIAAEVRIDSSPPPPPETARPPDPAT